MALLSRTRSQVCIDTQRFAYEGLHDGEEDALENAREWEAAAVFSTDDLREHTKPLLDWLAESGAIKVAINLDVVDSDEAVLGLGLRDLVSNGPSRLESGAGETRR